MGRRLFYRPGSWYITDDRTGFPTRSGDTRREWNGLQVGVGRWEARQPQDLVKGTKDDQTVPVARPLAPNVFVGPTFTQTTAAAPIGATVIPVQSTAGFANGQSVSLMLDSGVNFNTTLAAPPGAGTITLAAGLPYTMADGNNVTNNTAHVPPGQEP